MKKLFLLLLAGCLWSLAADAQPVIEKQGSKKEPFTFVQIADPQLGFCDKGQDWRWTVDNLKVTVARVNELKPAFVIVTGDLITTTFPSTGPKPWRSTSTKSVTTASRSPTTVLHSSG